MNTITSEIVTALLPQITPAVGVIVLMTIGTVCAVIMSKFVHFLLIRIKFTGALERIGWNNLLEQLDITLNTSSAIATICAIFFVILFAMMSFEVIGLHLFAGLLEKVVLYYPNIFVSLFLLITAAFAIDISQKLFIGTHTFKSIRYSRFLSHTVDWTIRILVFLAVFYQLGIIPQLIVILFAGVVFTVSLILGLSVGLGGREPMLRLMKEVGKTLW